MRRTIPSHHASSVQPCCSGASWERMGSRASPQLKSNTEAYECRHSFVLPEITGTRTTRAHAQSLCRYKDAQCPQVDRQRNCSVEWTHTHRPEDQSHSIIQYKTIYFLHRGSLFVVFSSLRVPLLNHLFFLNILRLDLVSVFFPSSCHSKQKVLFSRESSRRAVSCRKQLCLAYIQQRTRRCILTNHRSCVRGWKPENSVSSWSH